MNCNNCGAGKIEGAYCSYCGTALQELSEQDIKMTKKDHIENATIGEMTALANKLIQKIVNKRYIKIEYHDNYCYEISSGDGFGIVFKRAWLSADGPLQLVCIGDSVWFGRANCIIYMTRLRHGNEAVKQLTNIAKKAYEDSQIKDKKSTLQKLMGGL